MKKNIELKTVHLLDKFFHIIRNIQWEVSKKNKISPLMVQVIGYMGKKNGTLISPAKVAENLGVSRPTITDTLKSLIKKGYVREKTYKKDRRYKELHLTKKGKNLLKDINQNYREILKGSLKSLKQNEKENLFMSLINFIADLNRRGILPTAKMCLICESFERNKYRGNKPHYCRVLKIKMNDFDLNVDCERNVRITYS